ncbi:hypothetical protein L3Q82_004324 [Scortum barcoo]|uniref:Uncharacterized protein n=1 Tax=Scortum barcoo TaxID=214431 RepID=A0ACB8VJ82_9TELE|nr:hypothetical protein L3Q82_004324 [Scortum barcoo]
MGLERLLCGSLRCYSRLFRLGNIQNAPLSAHTAPSTTRTVNRVTWGPAGRSSVHTGRPGAAHSRVPALLCSSARRSFCSPAQPSRDVTLFVHDRTRFFRLLTVFCGGQFLFWTYLAHFAYTGLKDTGGGRSKASSSSSSSSSSSTTGLAGLWSFEMNLGSSRWRYGFTLGCLSIGAGIVGLGVLFCRRSVSRVVLHQGGRMVTVCTQSPLGPERGRRITVPLSQVACHAHRQESPSFVPLKVKGHKLYYLLDKEGTLNNARLFDITVGAYRPL